MVERATLENIYDSVPICYLSDTIKNTYDPLLQIALDIFKLKIEDICIAKIRPTIKDNTKKSCIAVYLKKGIDKEKAATALKIWCDRVLRSRS